MAEIVVERSPLAEFLDDMPSLIMQYEQMQVDQDEAAVQREHELSKMYLSHNLNRLERLNQELVDVENKSMELGLTGTQLNKIENPSSASIDIYNMSEKNLNNNINYLNDQISSRKQNISNYYSGSNLAKALDEDISGSISEVEMTGLSEDMINNEAFMMGIKNYTLNPLQMQQLKSAKTQDELAKLAIETEKINLKFLPDQREDEKRSRKISLDTGNLNLLQINEALEQAKINTEISKQNLSLGNLEIKRITETIDREDYAYNKQLIQDNSEAIDKALIQNITDQTNFGANILANISLELENDSYTPMFTILAAEDNEYLNEINRSRNVNLIKDEILDIYSGYGVGKAEETIPDYSLVVGTIENIASYKKEYDDFIKEFDWALDTGYMGNKYDMANIKYVLENTGHNYNSENILKHIQWNNTGIYKDLDLLNSAIKSNQQSNDLNAIKEQSLSLGVQFSNEEYKPNVYSDDDINRVLRPFTPIRDYGPSPTDSGSLNEEIFQQIFEEELNIRN